MRLILILCLVCVVPPAQAHAVSSGPSSPFRERLLLDQDWRFTLGGGPDGRSGGYDKFHAPEQTTVEGSVMDGRIVSRTDTPKSRIKDAAVPAEFNTRL